MKAFAWASLAVGTLFLAWAGTNHTRTSYYCQQCGMRATRDQREWMRLPIQNSFRPSDTRYSRVYKEAVTPTCQHQWTFTSSRSSGNLLVGGENGCGAFPYALRFDGYYPRLQILGSARAAAVLKALPLQPVVDWPHQREIMGALDELDGSSQVQANMWWNKYKPLFTPQKKLPKVSLSQ
jgi:hypothetical protein